MDFRPFYPAGLRALSSAIDGLLALGGFSILILAFSNATLRGLAGFDLAWSLEVTAFLLLWTTFLGCAAAIARGAHMRVTEISATLLNAGARNILEHVINLVIALLILSLIWHGWSIAAHQWAQKTTVLYWPVGLLYAAMPVGMALSLIFHLFNMWLHFRGTDIAGDTQA
ncbi:TRAP transporter small permease subunit [Marinovum sp. 2_MG-2023]|uniref:TRAP transporter small permease n=1 Tax=Roseobacteraceae TaxID=2854170 RepID=UPI001FD2CACB|nr:MULTISPECIES: TRAP transporter small permease subunit [Roseobacteraceae]MCJ7874135.1 TRAP transporter small permease [Phaeobacter sp. J2-8]MDO6730883.1 TRAP transporter small permease subunit [Marinovum sp. 2_MG-2023]MDO6780110.1 TRAP transporter small permease subunit [Marinovum sp. 1_MG-2023]